MPTIAPLLAVALLGSFQEPAARRDPPRVASTPDLNPLPPRPGFGDRPARLREGLIDVESDDIRHTVILSGNRRITLEGPPTPPGADRREAVPGGEPGRELDLQGMMLSRDNFDRFIFGPGGRADPGAHLHERLDARIRMVEAGRPLDEGDRRRLQLAGSGDIQHFYDRVEAARADFEVARRRYPTGMLAVRRLELLGIQYQEGPFGNGSLFRKVVTGIDRAQARR